MFQIETHCTSIAWSGFVSSCSPGQKSCNVWRADTAVSQSSRRAVRSLLSDVSVKYVINKTHWPSRCRTRAR